MEKTSFTYINSLDIGKFIMAIMVVAIHTTGLQSANNYYIQDLFRNITDLAVPFFFISSGFLLSKKTDLRKNITQKIETIKKYALRITRLYLVWSAIYLPFAIYGYFITKSTLIKACISYVLNLLFKGEHYYSWPLWYLLSVIYGAAILLFLTKRKCSHKVILSICILLFIIGQGICFCTDRQLLDFNSTVSSMIDLLFGNGRLISGISYFLLGWIIPKISIMKIGGGTAIILFSVIFIISIFSYKMFVWYFLKIILAYLLFEAVLSVKISKKHPFLRKTSTVMYFTHMIPFFIYSHIVGVEFAYGMMGFIISCLTTIMLSAVVIKINTKQTIFLFG